MIKVKENELAKQKTIEYFNKLNTASFDETDIFTDKRIQRILQIEE